MPNNDFTSCNAFGALKTHQQSIESTHLSSLFETDPARAERYVIQDQGLLLDYSKNLITDETCALMEELAKACGFTDKRKAMFSGAAINASENRAVLHTALRGSTDPSLSIEGENVTDFVNNALEMMGEITEKIRQNADIKHVVNIGIGGSDLGPRLVCSALAAQGSGPGVHFAANIDCADIDQILTKLKPENTIFIISSKTFTTLETMSNAAIAREWIAKALGDECIKDHFYAVTASSDKARDFGIQPDHILPLRDWIGGRYSVWSTIGLSLAVQIGFERFQDFLAGAYAMDQHFLKRETRENAPLMLGLLGVWHRNFWGYNAHAALPYAHDLRLFPAYLQQLDMESNGKSVTSDGSTVSHETGPIVFGAAGTNAQHAFFQLLHQGTEIIPADFIIFSQAKDASDTAHTKLVANALAQSQALMQGQKNQSEPHRNFNGGRPSNTLVLDKLDAYHMGMLLALYEHKTFSQGALWGINSFDQWGVELGKQMAGQITPCLEGNESPPEVFDSSTKALIAYLKQKT